MSLYSAVLGGSDAGVTAISDPDTLAYLASRDVNAVTVLPPAIAIDSRPPWEQRGMTFADWQVSQFFYADTGTAPPPPPPDPQSTRDLFIVANPDKYPLAWITAAQERLGMILSPPPAPPQVFAAPPPPPATMLTSQPPPQLITATLASALSQLSLLPLTNTNSGGSLGLDDLFSFDASMPFDTGEIFDSSSLDLAEVFGQDVDVLQDLTGVVDPLNVDAFTSPELAAGLMPGDDPTFGTGIQIGDAIGENASIADTILGPLSDPLKKIGAQILQKALPASLTGGSKVATVVPSLIRSGSTSLVAGAAAGVVRTVGGAARGVVTATGKFISSGKAVALAKKVGLETAAVALGLGVADMAQMVLSDATTHHKRGRGVTAAQLRTTRRTMHKVESMHRKIMGYCRDAGVGRSHRQHYAPRRAACPPPRVIFAKK